MLLMLIINVVYCVTIALVISEIKVWKNANGFTRVRNESEGKELKENLGPLDLFELWCVELLLRNLFHNHDTPIIISLSFSLLYISASITVAV